MKKLFHCLPVVMLLVSSCHNKQYKANSDNANLIHELNKGLMEAVVQDGFSPPVSSRVYAYPNIAAYEAVIHQDSNFMSYAGQLKGLIELPQPGKGKNYLWEIVMIQAFSDVAKYLVYRDYIIEEKYQSLLREARGTGVDEDEVVLSIEFGKELGGAIISWAKKDNYAATRNFSKFTVSDAPGSWKPTPPKYMEALEPHWAKVRSFVLDSTSQFREPVWCKFSTDKNSEFYKRAEEVYTIVNTLKAEKLDVCKFWDCNPSPINVQGHVVTTNRQNTPGGHWMGIARIAAKERKMSLVETCEVLSKTSIALADAFKVIWDSKYATNSIRPVTYIQKYIDPNWSPILETPNFPEFSSGHSGISAAAAYVLTEKFGASFSFTDSSNVPFGFAPRKFSSFSEAAEEAAISRVYGGIHYIPSCEIAAKQGIRVGEIVTKRLKTRK